MATLLPTELIESQLAHSSPKHIFIGYSGGIDSHVLLHLCAQVESIKAKIIAVYVHHGLQEEADAWARHCAKTVAELGVNFTLLRVNAGAKPGESPEEAARNARYKALKSIMEADDVLMMAQHREDQLETVLLQLFRGSGLRGLSGMAENTPFGLGVLIRPLINTSKQAIVDYAAEHKLQWVEDPSNQCDDFDRNFLRNNVIPLIKQRWTSCDKTVARSAKHCAEAQVIVTAVSDELFTPVFDRVHKTLRISQLQAHKSPRQQLIIRHWFQSLGLKMPAQAFVERIINEVIEAREDSDPILSGQGYSVRRYRDRLYCIKQSPQVAPQDCLWPKDELSITFADKYRLTLVPGSAGIRREQWQNSTVVIKFRQGGEKISLPGRKGHHSLKKLYQEADIPPWEREYIPLIFINNTLAAVGNYWISAVFYTEEKDACLSFAIEREEQCPKDHDETRRVD